LGCFSNVTEIFLLQALDKKLLQGMKVSNEGLPTAQAAGVWNTGKTLGEDCPMDQEDDGDSLIPVQACGAFVTALEDEFMGE